MSSAKREVHKLTYWVQGKQYVVEGVERCRFGNDYCTPLRKKSRKKAARKDQAGKSTEKQKGTAVKPVMQVVTRAPKKNQGKSAGDTTAIVVVPDKKTMPAEWGGTRVAHKVSSRLNGVLKSSVGAYTTEGLLLVSHAGKLLNDANETVDVAKSLGYVNVYKVYDEDKESSGVVGLMKHAGEGKFYYGGFEEKPLDGLKPREGLSGTPIFCRVKSKIYVCGVLTHMSKDKSTPHYAWYDGSKFVNEAPSDAIAIAESVAPNLDSGVCNTTSEGQGVELCGPEILFSPHPSRKVVIDDDAGCVTTPMLSPITSAVSRWISRKNISDLTLEIPPQLKSVDPLPREIRLSGLTDGIGATANGVVVTVDGEQRVVTVKHLESPRYDHAGRDGRTTVKLDCVGELGYGVLFDGLKFAEAPTVSITPRVRGEQEYVLMPKGGKLSMEFLENFSALPGDSGKGVYVRDVEKSAWCLVGLISHRDRNRTVVQYYGVFKKSRNGGKAMGFRAYISDNAIPVSNKLGGIGLGPIRRRYSRRRRIEDGRRPYNLVRPYLERRAAQSCHKCLANIIDGVSVDELLCQCRLNLCLQCNMPMLLAGMYCTQCDGDREAADIADYLERPIEEIMQDAHMILEPERYTVNEYTTSVRSKTHEAFCVATTEGVLVVQHMLTPVVNDATLVFKQSDGYINFYHFCGLKLPRTLKIWRGDMPDELYLLEGDTPVSVDFRVHGNGLLLRMRAYPGISGTPVFCKIAGVCHLYGMVTHHAAGEAYVSIFNGMTPNRSLPEMEPVSRLIKSHSRNGARVHVRSIVTQMKHRGEMVPVEIIPNSVKPGVDRDRKWWFRAGSGNVYTYRGDEQSDGDLVVPPRQYWAAVGIGSATRSIWVADGIFKNETVSADILLGTPVRYGDHVCGFYNGVINTDDGDYATVATYTEERGMRMFRPPQHERRRSYSDGKRSSQAKRRQPELRMSRPPLSPILPALAFMSLLSVASTSFVLAKERCDISRGTVKCDISSRDIGRENCYKISNGSSLTKTYVTQGDVAKGGRVGYFALAGMYKFTPAHLTHELPNCGYLFRENAGYGHMRICDSEKPLPEGHYRRGDSGLLFASNDTCGICANAVLTHVRGDKPIATFLSTCRAGHKPSDTPVGAGFSMTSDLFIVGNDIFIKRRGNCGDYTVIRSPYPGLPHCAEQPIVKQNGIWYGRRCVVGVDLSGQVIPLRCPMYDRGTPEVSEVPYRVVNNITCSPISIFGCRCFAPAHTARGGSAPQGTYVAMVGRTSGCMRRCSRRAKAVFAPPPVPGSSGKMVVGRDHIGKCALGVAVARMTSVSMRGASVNGTLLYSTIDDKYVIPAAAELIGKEPVSALPVCQPQELPGFMNDGFWYAVGCVKGKDYRGTVIPLDVNIMGEVAATDLQFSTPFRQGYKSAVEIDGRCVSLTARHLGGAPFMGYASIIAHTDRCIRTCALSFRKGYWPLPVDGNSGRLAYGEDSDGPCAYGIVTHRHAGRVQIQPFREALYYPVNSVPLAQDFLHSGSSRLYCPLVVVLCHLFVTVVSVLITV